MRLGIGSYGFAWSIGVPGHPPARPMTALDLLAAADELRVRVVQICDNLPLDRLPYQEFDRLAKQAAERNIQIEVGTRGIQPEHLSRYLQLAVRLQSPILRVVVDTADHHPSPEEVVGCLHPLLRKFTDAGVCLAIENHDRFRARQFVEIVQRLESPAVGICLDTVNSFGALEGPEVVVQALGSWTVNLHLKDFHIRRVDHQMGFLVEGKPAGQGQLNVPWLLEQLRSAGRVPNTILEQWPLPETTIEATIAKEKAWARESIFYLRTLIAD
ncbi:MAG: sugar phosphate isomerase/epimerase family protein [Thermoguttaceae bacterium]